MSSGDSPNSNNKRIDTSYISPIASSSFSLNATFESVLMYVNITLGSDVSLNFYCNVFTLSYKIFSSSVMTRT